MRRAVNTIVRRVLLTTDAVGGVWRYSVDLANELASRGIHVDLVVLGPQPSLSQRLEVEESREVELIVADLPLEWTADSEAEMVEAGLQLARIAVDRGPDVIHLNNPAFAATACWPACVVVALHSCVATWWRAVHPLKPYPEDLQWRSRLIGRGLATAAAAIAPTAAFATDASAVYGVSRPFTVVHNGRSMADQYPPLPGRNDVFTCGRLWDKAKNMAALDEAASMVDIPIRAAGPLERRKSGVFRAEHLELMGDLPSAGIRSQLARTRIYVSPALYEPFGLGVLEAAQAGCALILSDIATFRELWDNAACFIDPADPASIAQAIAALRAEPGLLDRLSAAAVRRSGRFSSSAAADKTLDAYHQALVNSEEIRRGAA